mmetsp:Transcript_8330/g.9588  ORF Transcript_8330/g.9588 Transcript_8330/m.9588 type:complete len:385 (+) Transcript_8330:91-1245(+)
MMTITSVKRAQLDLYDDTLAPNYKPRYLIEETTSLLSEKSNDSITLASCLTRCCCYCLSSLTFWFSRRCFLSFCCGTRRRVAILILISCVCCIFVNIVLLEPLALSIGNSHNFVLGKRQSFYFFEDIPQSRWKLLQKRVHDQRKRQKKSKMDPSRYTSPSQFYKHNFQPDFTCPHEERVGAVRDGGKWLCDPRSIAAASLDRRDKHDGNGCLIYSTSGNVNEFKFEELLMAIIGDCEVHIFSPNVELERVQTPQGIYLHPWGFKGEKSKNDDVKDSELKSIKETLELLGHCGKTVDVFSIDCEGCEFDIFQDLFHNDEKNDECAPAAFLQILIEVHGAPHGITNEFFTAFQNEGYVTFHKEHGLDVKGNEQDYGFLKLSDDFFY